MTELIKAHQYKYEPVDDFINHWRSLSLNCKDHLSKTSSIKICIQGINWGLHYILQGLKTNAFEELKTHVHNIKLNMDIIEDQ